MLIWFLLFNLYSLVSVAVGHSTEGGSPTSGKNQGVETTITSKKMSMKNQDNQAVFEGTVVLTRGALVVHSNRMVISFHSPEMLRRQDELKGEVAEPIAPLINPASISALSNRSVSQIEATGQVKIKKESGSAICEKAVFYQKADMVVLTGNPVVWEKGTRVSGEKITMFLGEDRSVVEGTSHLQIEPDGESTK